MWFDIFDNLTNNKTFSPLIYFILENWAHLQYRLVLYDIQLTGYFENPSLLLSSSAALWIQQELNKELIESVTRHQKSFLYAFVYPGKLVKKDVILYLLGVRLFAGMWEICDFFGRI